VSGYPQALMVSP